MLVGPRLVQLMLWLVPPTLCRMLEAVIPFHFLGVFFLIFMILKVCLGGRSPPLMSQPQAKHTTKSFSSDSENFGVWTTSGEVTASGSGRLNT